MFDVGMFLQQEMLGPSLQEARAAAQAGGHQAVVELISSRKIAAERVVVSEVAFEVKAG